MKILKFGGSSVGSVENVKRIHSILKKQKDPFIIVVSAFSGVTNQLQELSELALADDFQPALEALRIRHQEMMDGLGVSDNKELKKAIDKEFKDLKKICNGISILQEKTEKSQARIMSKGELLSSLILYHYFLKENLLQHWIDSRTLITTDSNYLQAQVYSEITDNQIVEAISDTDSTIIPGFISSDTEGETTLLGRGGSDFTATLMGRAIHAEAVELWSDVNGLQNADPRIVKEAKPIREMTYEEAFEMSYFGAKVIYPPSIKPAMEADVPVYLKNTLEPDDEGTKISGQIHAREDSVLGVSTLKNLSIIEVSGVGLAKPGKANLIFSALADKNINVLLITKSSSEQSISLVVHSEEAALSKEALQERFSEEIRKKSVNPIHVENEQVILALIGDQMKHHVGLSGSVFSSLGENNINVRAIAQGSTERNISIVVGQKDADKSLKVVHERFFQGSLKKYHLFVVGKGNVGQEFLDIVQQQQEYCKKQLGVEILLAFVANSSGYIFNEDGITSDDLAQFSEKAIAYESPNQLVNFIIDTNLRNSIVVDNTASQDFCAQYLSLFRNSISVATCNKISVSSRYSEYELLKKETKKHNCSFQYETTVGASLPIIKTIRDLRMSGDVIYTIKAVLSGSLNFIFNKYDGKKSFSELVQLAMSEGYTEPDPRIDLSGLDVRRKLLILARECGRKIEMDDIVFESFLPEGALETNSVDEFLQVLQDNESFFKSLYDKAEQSNSRLKVIAQMDGDTYKVGLEMVPQDSPFYYLGGKDNIITLGTSMYQPEPLVIKGAGAGAKITASGVFADVMYIVNQEL